MSIEENLGNRGYDAERERIISNYDRKSKSIVRRSTLGVICGVGILLAGIVAGLGEGKENPYAKTESVKQYQEMDSSLNVARRELGSLTEEADLIPSYVPENARGEFEIVYDFGNERELNQKIAALEGYITKVEEDITGVRNSEDFQRYDNWNRDSSKYVSLPIGVGIACLSLMYNAWGFSMNQRRERRELSQLDEKYSLRKS